MLCDGNRTEQGSGSGGETKDVQMTDVLWKAAKIKVEAGLKNLLQKQA